METLDVNKITDIPGIERYLSYEFELVIYERSDKTAIYRCYLENLHEIKVEIITDETLILGNEQLVDIMVHYDGLIGYFFWVVKDDLGNTISAYHYRPNVSESQKTYE